MTRKFSTIILAILLMITTGGCQKKKKTDSERFAEEYGISTNAVSYMEEDDVVYQISHGTHAVLITDSSDIDKIKSLCLAAEGHSGMMIFYISSRDVSTDTADAVIEELNPYYPIEKLAIPAIFFVKDGAVVEAVMGEGQADYSALFDSIAASHNPGCNDC